MKYRRYIRGDRRGKEANRIEKEAMKDPFLADALEGYERITEEDPIPRVNDIRKRIHNTTRRRHFIIRNWSAAASLLILFGLGCYFLLYKIPSTPGNQIAMESAREQEQITKLNEKEIIPHDSSTGNKALAHNQEWQRQSAPPPAPVVTEENLMIAEDNTLLDSSAIIEEEEAIVEVYAAPLPVQAEIAENSRISSFSALSSKEAIPQATSVMKGKVTDEKGEPLPGASVLLEGTTKGAITDMDGYFQLDVPGNGEIKIEYIGFESISQLVDTTKTVHIAMHEDKQQLDEMIVSKSLRKERSISDIPTPVDGKKVFNEYIKANLTHPTDSECKKSKGKVTLTFYINEKGRPYNIQIKKSLCPSADTEAIRLIEDGPNWTYGIGKAEWDIKF